MRKIRTSWIILLILCLSAPPIVYADVAEWADMLVNAHNRGEKIPLVSVQHPGLDVETAYDIQKAFVRKQLENDRIAGFKAGLTSEAGQKKFGVTSPLAGVLFESGRKRDHSAIPQSEFKKLMIETEIGFVIGEKITKQIKDEAELRKHIRGVTPVIELPDLGFADMKQLKGADIIAANVAAAQFIAGEGKPFADNNLNAVTVTLSLDGQEISKGKGSDAMGDQWKAAVWLINRIVAQGYQITPGNVVITGVLGKMLPGKPGKYEADYGDFGKLSFVIK